MKHFRLIFGLALIPIGTILGSLVPIGRGGSGIIIGFVVGCVLSCLFLIYGPGHKKNQLLTSDYENGKQLNQQPFVNQQTEWRRQAVCSMEPQRAGVFKCAGGIRKR